MKFWRWNLHAAITTLAVSPLMLGWAWGLPLLSPNELTARAANASQAEIAAAGTLAALGPVEDLRPLVARITTYRVEADDTLQDLARRFGISPETLLWANTVGDPSRLAPGLELTVLPVSGVLHTASEGDTLANLAERYGATVVRLIEANGLAEPYALSAGQRLIVPGASPLPPTPPTRLAEWPAPGTGERNKRQFIEASAVAAQDAQRRLRIPASVTIAQAIHESYWGTSGLARNANNFFGIKARNGEGSAGTYWMEAWEVVDGEDVVLREPFRKYLSPDESFYDHGMFFLRNSRYQGAFRYSENPRAFARAIADAGYATDPGYAPKLIRIMDQYNLYQYDLP